MSSSHETETPALKLENIRSQLIRLEESIIFSLIERAQFKRNDAIYVKNKFAGLQTSFLEYFLAEMEAVHSTSRRYTAPDEHPFFPDRLLKPVLPPLEFPSGIVPNNININDKVMKLYIEMIVPRVCAAGDDQHYGSSANCDIAALWAISKRIHYGKFVAEAKFRGQTAKFTELITKHDEAGIMDALTNVAVEEKLLKRVHLKASTYGRDPEDDPKVAPEYKVDPQVIVDLYKDFLIPLNKEVQVAYLLQRLSVKQVAFLGPLTTFSHQIVLKEFGTSVKLLPCETIPEVFDKVRNVPNMIGVVPLENNYNGPVGPTLIQLNQPSPTIKITKELSLPISLCLATHPMINSEKDTLRHVRRIYSHAQPLGQCRKFLEEHFHGQVELVPVESTAKAAITICEEDKRESSAAIVSEVTANEYHLFTVFHNIQDHPDNRTRFLVLEHDPTGSGKPVDIQELLSVPSKAE